MIPSSILNRTTEQHGYEGTDDTDKSQEKLELTTKENKESNDSCSDIHLKTRYSEPMENSFPSANEFGSSRKREFPRDQTGSELNQNQVEYKYIILPTLNERKRRRKAKRARNSSDNKEVDQFHIDLYKQNYKKGVILSGITGLAVGSAGTLFALYKFGNDYIWFKIWIKVN